MYNASIPVFLRYLNQLDKMLISTQQHLTMSETDLLRSRLAPDMLPLWQQILMTVGFALRGCAPLAELETPYLDYHEKGLSLLHQDIKLAKQFLASIQPEQLSHVENLRITHQAGHAQLTMNGADYLYQFALPNFFFHMTCVYAILRQQGVTLGKQDFDGFHQY